MDFPIELERDSQSDKLRLKVSSLEIFEQGSVFVPAEQIEKLEFFNVTYEGHYTIQEIEKVLREQGQSRANAYREIRTIESVQDRPYKKIKTTTFRAYVIPQDLAKKERAHCLALAQSCTS